MKSFLGICVLSLAFMLVQCRDNPTQPEQYDSFSRMEKGKKGGGGHTVTTGNNLSFPALYADGYNITEILEENFSFTVPYTGAYEGLTASEIAELQATGPWYAQKVEGNVWQADFEPLSNPNVAFVDWGDAIEAVDPKVGRPYRLELVLYQGGANMLGFKMAELAFPSSKDETQGTNTETYTSQYASIVTSQGRMIVQRFDEGAELIWNETLNKWDGADNPESGLTFSPELNVGGKYIFGASKKGWKPKVIGNYRITFYLENSDLNLVGSDIGNYNNGSPEFPEFGENNTPHVHGTYNLTYVDVQAEAGGGGGGGH